MIFGITLKHYKKLIAKGEKAGNSFWIKYLLLKKSNRKIKTNDILQLSFSNFVDCERFLENANYIDFCNIFVKKWQRVYVHNLESIINDYNSQKSNLVEIYRYVFNPPIYGIPTPETLGSELRKDFVKEFGNWTVLMDLVCKDKTKYKEVEAWNLQDFLFWADYLSGQRILENVK